MKRMHVLIFALAVAAVSLISGRSTCADEGFPVRVTQRDAAIKVETRVKATVNTDMLLWVFELSADEQWAQVKVPASDVMGWVSVNDITSVEIPDASQATWNSAIGYFAEWQRLIDSNQPLEAAKVAVTAGDTMIQVLEDMIGAVYPGYPPSAVAYNQAGVAFLQADEPEKAFEQFSRAIEISESSIGTKHTNTAVQRANAAETLVFLKRYSEAIQAFDTSLPRLEAADNPDVDLESYFVRYGTALAHEHRIFDARLAFSRALRIAVSKRGERSREVAGVATAFATAMDQAGQRTDAVKQLQRALEIYRDLIDPEHPTMLDTLNRASAYSARAADYQTAKTFAEEAVRIQRSMDQPHPFLLGSALNNLGLALAKLHEFDEAESVLDEAASVMIEATRPDSFVSSFPLKNQGVLALEQKDTAGAKALFQQVLAIRTATQTPDHASVGAAKFLLGQVAILEDNATAANELLTEAVRIQGNDLGIDHPDTRKTIAFLRKALGDDTTAEQNLDLVIAEARLRLRRQVVSSKLDPFYKLDSIASVYRLQRILSQKGNNVPDDQFYALEVTGDNVSVRTGGVVPTSIPKGTLVYAFGSEGSQALIKVPGKDAVGMIGQDSVRELTYSEASRGPLEAAELQLDAGWADYAAGDFPTAINRIRAAVQVFETELGEQRAHTARARDMLGSVLADAGEAKIAVEECQKAEAVLMALLGENHAQTAIAQNNLANALLVLGRPAEALKPAAQALRTFSSFGDERKSEQAKFAGTPGRALVKLSHFEAAREYLEYALKLSVEANGENHRDVARCYENLGELHTAMKDYNAAEEALAKAYRISEKVAGPAHPSTTRAMIHYGRALVTSQKISAGRKLIEKAATINLKQRGALDVSTMHADFSRAELAREVGDTATARRLMTSVVKRALRKLGAENPQVLRYQRALGRILFDDQQYDDALNAFQQTSTAFVDLLGEQNSETIESINAIGSCSAALGRLDVARVNYERALRLGQQVLGPDHPDTTGYLLNIGEVALMAKDYVAARPRIEASIDAYRQGTQVADVDTCVARTLLGYVEVGQHDTRSARAAFDTAARDTFEVMSHYLPALSEKEQLMFLQNDLRDMQDAWLTLPLTDTDNAAMAEAAATWHLNMKASSHELLATQARLAKEMESVENQAAVQELIAVREQLARLSLRSVPPDARQAHDEALRKLTADEERLAREIGDQVSKLKSPREWLSLEDIRPNISPQSVLINFARIRRANYEYSSQRSRWKGDRYLAWIVSGDIEQDVVTVDLGLADAIDRRIASSLQAIHSNSAVSSMKVNGELEATETLQVELSALAQSVLHPLLPFVKDAEELILSPDGQLWTIPWAALPASDNQLTIEKYRIRLLVSGRELQTLAKAAPSSQDTTAPLIVADPRFDLNLLTTSIVRNEAAGDQLRGASDRFSEAFRNAKRLPGTAAEAEAIKESVESFAGIAPQMFLQETAAEAIVKSARSPFCLVMSTHGFFFDGSKVVESGSRSGRSASISENPLLRCGLLLAGCHHAETAPEGTDDGILTGMEIVNSDLRNTELVVLSACETGLGDLRSGEGVAGLRQAFQLAGAKSVVASLWQVEDDATARLMAEVFANLARGMSKSEALRQAQLARIKVRRDRFGAAHPFYWAAFTLTGSD